MVRRIKHCIRISEVQIGIKTNTPTPKLRSTIIDSCQTVDGIKHPTCFRKLRQSELNYSTVEKEALMLITAVRVFSVYYGSQLVTVYTDHRPLEYIHKMKTHNAKLSCWSVALGQYALLDQHRPGKATPLPHLLS